LKQVALFFDARWFDAALAAKGLTRDDLAHNSNVSGDDLTLIFKDQMEVSAQLVQFWASLLGHTPCEVAKRCGVSTPYAAPQSEAARIAALEAQVADLIKQLNAKS
jgi:transcriptional regulator with XRE-family HTH domain